MKHPLLLPLVAAVLVSSLAGGCAKSVNFDTWRAGVEDYVKNHAAGDPTALRELNVDASHPGYRLNGSDRPSESTDAVGVLVGNAVAADRPWIVFLVGLVEKQKVKDIRVAALSVHDNRYAWRMGKKDDKALKAYVDYNKGLAHRRFPDRKKEPAEYLGFPREDDRFEMTQQGDAIGVTHEPSGAKWHVTVTPSGKQ
jgi:hypothetical protein